MIGHDTRDPASVLGSPQDAVEVWEVLENVVTFFGPVAQSPVPHLGALEDKREAQIRSQSTYVHLSRSK